jgi:hypothetical protein
VNIFNEQASILARRFDELIKQPDKTYDLYPYISACTLDIIAGTVNSLLTYSLDHIISIFACRNSNWHESKGSIRRWKKRIC